MKLKKMMLVAAMLQIVSPIHASDLLTSMTTAQTDLYNAQVYLSSLLGISTLSPITLVPSTTTITNDDYETVFLALFNQNSQQINPTLIPVHPGEFSYVPGDAVKVQIVNEHNKQLVPMATLDINTLYSIMKQKNGTWRLLTLPNHRTYNYTNSTTATLGLSVISDTNEVISTEIEPGAVFVTDPIDPTDEVVVAVHANVSGTYLPYDSEMSYNIIVGPNNELELSGKIDSMQTITNNSGWNILITIIDSNSSRDQMLKNGESYSPKKDAQYATNIMMIPLIDNYMSKSAPVESITITNVNGELRL